MLVTYIIFAAEKLLPKLGHTVSVGQEFWNNLVGWFWFRVSRGVTRAASFEGLTEAGPSASETDHVGVAVGRRPQLLPAHCVGLC